MMVYRVEDPDLKVGPYYNGNDGKQSRDLMECFMEHTDADRHPIPAEDGIEKPPFAPAWLFNFGFRSMAQLTRWFSERERQIMARDGYKVIVYEVPDQYVIEGHRQVIFIEDMARKVRMMSPDRLAVA